MATTIIVLAKEKTMEQKFIQVLVMCFAAASISVTVTYSGLFKGMRSWFKKEGKFGKLINCSYCFSHYVIGVMILFTSPQMFFPFTTYIGYFFTLLATYFAMVSVTALISWGIKKSFMREETIVQDLEDIDNLRLSLKRSIEAIEGAK